VRGAWEYVREVYDQAATDNIFFLAGGLTFSLLLAAIPFLILILSLAGIALAPRIDAPENAVMEWLATLMPVNPATEAQLREQLAAAAPYQGASGSIAWDNGGGNRAAIPRLTEHEPGRFMRFRRETGEVQ